MTDLQTFEVVTLVYLLVEIWPILWALLTRECLRQEVPTIVIPVFLKLNMSDLDHPTETGRVT